MIAENKIKLDKIFRLVLEIGDNEDIMNVRRINHPRWDSLAHVSLITAVESEFGVSISGTSKVNEITSFQAAETILSDMEQ